MASRGEPKMRDASAAEINHDVLVTALDVEQSQRGRLSEDLEWLVTLWNEGVHSYSEPDEPMAHPVGLNTDSMTAKFNAADSGRAVDLALD